MFDEKVRVAGWVINELPYELLESITRENLDTKMNNAIDDTIYSILQGESTGNYLAQSGEDRRERDNLIELLKSYKELSPEDKLVDPILHNQLPGVYDVRPELFRNLHARLAKFKEEADAQENDLFLRLSMSEIEQRNLEETNEFHKKMSAYSNFPFLLKQTGWLWEYTIPNVNLSDSNYIKFVPNFLPPSPAKRSL